MEYIYGTARRNGVTVENLKTVGAEHTELAGYIESRRTFDDGVVITDRCKIQEHYRSEEADGLCYDWYIISDHYRYTGATDAAKLAVQRSTETNNLVFVAMAEAGSIDDATAGEHVELFAEWAYPVTYTPGQMRVDPLDGCLYRVNEGQGHTSQQGWNPSLVPALWTKAADPNEEWPAWSQPIGKDDAYRLGAKVSHNGKHWTCTGVDGAGNNVWEPGVFGWTEEA